MSYAGRPIASHIRQSSVANSQNALGPSPALLARIEEKKAELASLKELQRLSAGVADQMQALEEKLATLSDGTEAIAAVLSNWHNVLRAITLASTKLPKPKDAEAEMDEAAAAEPQLPQTLVRIPTQQAHLIPQASSGANAE